MTTEEGEKSGTDPSEFVGELVVTEEDYQEGLKRGWTNDDMLKPGRYKLKRLDFLKRSPELKDKMRKRA